jgi:WXXGXW repeat (2 copies)
LNGTSEADVNFRRLMIGRPTERAAQPAENQIDIALLATVMLTRIRYVLLALFLGAIPATSFGFVEITIAPPVLPVYEQPPCPGDGYIWTPGYWAYGDDGYYWVPGVWIEPPRIGVLWTPGYWGFVGNVYAWHPGYWAPHVGFYGGINYGFGYGGVGFFGGEWQGDVYRYNTAVTRVDTTVVRNVYVNNTVINNSNTATRASFNGTGGVTAQPTAEEQKVSQEQHIAATTAQRNHEQSALHDRNQSASANNGQPKTTALTSTKATEPTRLNKGGVNQNEPKATPKATASAPKAESKTINKEPVNRSKNKSELKQEQTVEPKAHENKVNPQANHPKEPSGPRHEAVKPTENKASPKPHGEKRSNEKGEKSKE